MEKLDMLNRQQNYNIKSNYQMMKLKIKIIQLKKLKEKCLILKNYQKILLKLNKHLNY